MKFKEEEIAGIKEMEKKSWNIIKYVIGVLFDGRKSWNCDQLLHGSMFYDNDDDVSAGSLLMFYIDKKINLESFCF